MEDYSSMRTDNLTEGEEIEIKHRVYAKNVNIAPLIAMGKKSIEELRRESIDGERKAFEIVKAAAGQWEEQAAVTQLYDMALKYLSAPEVKNTKNEWVNRPVGTGKEISNSVYKMWWSIRENRNPDWRTREKIPTVFYASWAVVVNSPKTESRRQIAGQDSKRYIDKNEAEKYIEGRIKAYAHLFQEVNPPVPKRYTACFSMYGLLLPGYRKEEQVQKASLLEKLSEIRTGEAKKPGIGDSEREDARLEDSMDLAYDLDEFFRDKRKMYAGTFPDAQGRKEQIADALAAGHTGDIRMRLVSFQEREGYDREAKIFEKRLADFEKKYGIAGYSVYQLKETDDTENLHFMSYEWLEKQECAVARTNYDIIYAAERSPEYTLDDIFAELNNHRPKGFHGYSLSVSDIVVLHENGESRAYYVDSIGFKELPDFLEHEKSAKEQTSICVKEQLKRAKKQAVSSTDRVAEKKKSPERS